MASRGARAARGAVEVDGVKAPGLPGHELPGLVVEGIEGLQRVGHDNGVARLTPWDTHRAIDHVEQLADRNGRRAPQVRPLVATRVGDDQPLARREKCVEQQLAVFAADVTVTDAWLECGQIVPVALDVPRKAAVVEPEEADHLVGDGPHGHEGAHGQMPGAEVGAGGLTLQAVGQDRPHVVTAEDDAADATVGGGLLDHVFEQRGELGPLPHVLGCRQAQRIRNARQGLRPFVDGAEGDKIIGCAAESIDELGQSTGELDFPRVDVIERRGAFEEPFTLVGHGDAEKDPVEPRAPGVRTDAAQSEGLPMLGIEPPAHVGLAYPFLEPGQVVVAETEAATDRLASRQVDDLGRLHPRAGEIEDLGEHAHERVGAPQGTVGQANLELRRRVFLPVDPVTDAEGGLDERREVLDVRAHDDDVAQLELWVGLELVQDRIAYDLDLSRPSVARMDADAVVALHQQRTRVALRAEPTVTDRLAVGAHILLDQAQQGGRLRLRLLGVTPVGDRPAQDELHFVGIAPHDASSGLCGRAAVGSSRRKSRRDAGPTSDSNRSHNVGDGCSKKRCTSRLAPKASRTSR